MKTGYMLLSTAAIVPLLTSCASYQKSADTDAWSIKPVMSIRNSVESADAYYQLGRYYQGQNRYELSALAYQKALALDGRFAEARNGLGVMYSVQGKLVEAIEQFRLAVELAPSAAHIHNNLGYALYLGAAYVEAAQVLEHAALLDPANQATRANLAQAKKKATTAGQMMAQTPSTPVLEEPTGEPQLVSQPSAATRAILPVAPQPRVTVGGAPPTPAATVASISVPATPPMAEIAVQTSAPAYSQAKDTTVAVSPATASTMPQPEQQRQADELAAGSARSGVQVVESHVQVVQVEPNVYELQERVEARSTLVPLDQSKVQAKGQGMIMPVVQARPTSARMVQGRIHVGAQSIHEQRQQSPSRSQTSVGATKQIMLEVSNGNGLTGMAGKVAKFLVDFGYVKTRLTNQRPFQVQLSEVQYRTGYRDEALSLMASMPGKPILIEVDGLRQDINIRVVLGKDWLREVAYFDKLHQGKIRLVRTGSDT